MTKAYHVLQKFLLLTCRTEYKALSYLLHFFKPYAIEKKTPGFYLQLLQKTSNFPVNIVPFCEHLFFVGKKKEKMKKETAVYLNCQLSRQSDKKLIF